MKKLLTLLTAVAGFSVAAQPLPVDAQKQHKVLIQSILSGQSSTGSAQKTTGLQQRLVALKSTAYNWQSGQSVGYDSTSYRYNNNDRGSSFDFDEMAYSLTNISEPNPFVKSDTASYWMQETGQPAPRLVYRNIVTYTPAANIADFILYQDSATGGLDKARHTGYTYNAQDKPVRMIRQRDSMIPPVWKDQYQYFYIWDAQGKKLADSIMVYYTGTPAIAARMLYDYNAYGDLVAVHFQGYNNGTFQPYQETVNTFYPNHLLKSSNTTFVTMNGSGTIDSFGYNANSDLDYRYNAEYNYLQVRTSGQIYTRHVNAQGLPDTIYRFQLSNSQWGLSSKNVFTYNAYNHPALSLEYHYPNNNLTLNEQTEYFYEEYNATAAIAAVAQQEHIALFPNPAGNRLFIKWDGAAAGTPVTINITNACGQTAYTQCLQWDQDIQQFETGDLQPGIYFAIIMAKDKRRLYTGQFVKY